MTKRLNKVYLIIGKKGTGKTFFTKVLMKLHPLKVLVFDTYDHPDYRDVVKNMPVELMGKWKSGNYRILSVNPEKDLPEIADKMYNCLLILEDAKRYIEGNVPSYIKKMFIEHKNRNVDIIMQFHSLSDVSPYAVKQSSHLVMFETKDYLDGNTPEKWATWWHDIIDKQKQIRDLNSQTPGKPWHKMEIELE